MTGWLKTSEIYFLVVLRARSLISECQYGCIPFEDLRGKFILASLLLVVTKEPLCSLSICITPIHVSVSHGCLISVWFCFQIFFTKIIDIYVGPSRISMYLFRSNSRGCVLLSFYCGFDTTKSHLGRGSLT